METSVTLSLAESLLGCVVKIDKHPGYDSGLFVHLPPSFHGDMYCLKGYGMPLVNSLIKHGDLYIRISVVEEADIVIVYSLVFCEVHPAAFVTTALK